MHFNLKAALYLTRLGSLIYNSAMPQGDQSEAAEVFRKCLSKLVTQSPMRIEISSLRTSQYLINLLIGIMFSLAFEDRRTSF